MGIEELAQVEIYCLFDFLEELHAHHLKDWGAAVHLYGGKVLHGYYLNHVGGCREGNFLLNMDCVAVRQDVISVYQGLSRMVAMQINHQTIEAHFLFGIKIPVAWNDQLITHFNTAIQNSIELINKATADIGHVDPYDQEFWLEAYSNSLSKMASDSLSVITTIDRVGAACYEKAWFEETDFDQRHIDAKMMLLEQRRNVKKMIFDLYLEQDKASPFSEFFHQAKTEHIRKLNDRCVKGLICIDEFSRLLKLKWIGSYASIYKRPVEEGDLEVVSNYFKALAELPYLQKEVAAVATLNVLSKGRFSLFASSNLLSTPAPVPEIVVTIGQ